ncbi:hypothetical protein BOV90_07445 [Solemya velum gill symbiont]|nr:hypothetical protein BOV90_07445 [Solemya velum gill symbiont]
MDEAALAVIACATGLEIFGCIENQVGRCTGNLDIKCRLCSEIERTSFGLAFSIAACSASGPLVSRVNRLRREELISFRSVGAAIA